MNMWTDIIAESLATSINNCLIQDVFLKNVKIVSLTPRNKGKPKKYEVLNYKPGGILSTFSKIYEKIIKNKLIYYFDKVFSPCLAV